MLHVQCDQFSLADYEHILVVLYVEHLRPRYQL